MFHKNSKAISPFKYRLGVSQLWRIDSAYMDKKINNRRFYVRLFILICLESLFSNLTRGAKKIFRLRFKNKKRKFNNFFHLLQRLKPETFKNFGVLYKVYKKRKILQKRRISLIKNKFKYRFKLWRLKKKN